jgi:hypothetical protein
MSLFPRVISLMGLTAVLCAVVAAAAAAAAMAAPAPPAPGGQAGAKAQAPPRLPLVIITNLDGTTARGQLLSADPDNVVIRANDRAEPVSIPWTSIQRVSNGLTQAQAWAAWKEQHKDELCDACRGDRVVKCPACFGSGVDQAKLTPCAQCEGSGIESVCAAPRCNGTGKVDCPKPCLKLTQGTWRVRDGKRWRDFPTAKGVFSISEGHLGELVDLKNGGSQGKCPTCDGTTKVDCPQCAGMGVIACATCEFAGATGPACPQCKAGNVACATCKGSGLRPRE